MKMYDYFQVEAILSREHGYISSTDVLNLVDAIELRLTKKDAQDFLSKLKEALWLEIVCGRKLIFREVIKLYVVSLYCKYSYTLFVKQAQLYAL